MATITVDGGGGEVTQKPTDNATQQQTGTSGQRFVYGSQYKDPIFAILFIGMLITLIVVCIIEYAGNKIHSSYGTLFGILMLLMAIGTMAGIAGFYVIRAIPEIIIKLMLFIEIGIAVLAGIIMIAVNAIGAAVIWFIFAGISLLYVWCIWHRIPFATALLWISTRIVSKYHGVIWTALGALILQFFFYILWILVIIAVASEGSGLGYFFLTICLYWGVETFSNISHTTSCGVAATWFFTHQNEYNSNVTWNSFKRSITTSFGSICFGSLLIAIIQALRSSSRSGRNGGAALLSCLLACCEAWLRYFNDYAFAQVAIYGTTFYQSAKNTYQLIANRGWWAIINDSLIRLAIVAGSMIAGFVAAILGALIGAGVWSDDSNQLGYIILLAIIGFIVGYCMARVVLRPVESAVVALFVCYAEDPETLKVNHIDEYNRLVQANPIFIVQVQVVQVVQVNQMQPVMQNQMQMQMQMQYPQGQYPQQYPQGQYPQQYPQGQYPQQYPQGQYPQQYPQQQYPQQQYPQQPQQYPQGQTQGPPPSQV